MAVLSILRTAVRLKSDVNALRKITNFSCVPLIPPRIIADQIRWMSDKRTMAILPSRYQWKKFWDFLHYYLLLGVIPLSILTFCVNVFVGPAQLADIPEGYEPKHWEYYKHPIERFLARYIYPSRQQEYEKMMHFINEEHELILMTKLQKRVKQLQSERGDYKSWYYVPETGRYYRAMWKELDELEERETGDAKRVS